MEVSHSDHFPIGYSSIANLDFAIGFLAIWCVLVDFSDVLFAISFVERQLVGLFVLYGFLLQILRFVHLAYFEALLRALGILA